MKTKHIILSLLLSMVIGAIGTWVFINYVKTNELIPEVGIITKDTTTLNKHNLKREIAKYPFYDRSLVIKSAIYEAGHSLDSYNATARNNIFGMNCSLRRYACKGGYSVYPTWQESVKDRYIHEALYFRGGGYRDYINRNWGTGDGTYCDYLDKIEE